MTTIHPDWHNANGAQCSQLKFNSLTLELIRRSVCMQPGPPQASVSAFSRLPSILSPSKDSARKRVRTQVGSHTLISPIATQRKSILKHPTTNEDVLWHLETLILLGRIVLNFFDPAALLPHVNARYGICVFGASVDMFFVWKCFEMFWGVLRFVVSDCNIRVKHGKSQWNQKGWLKHDETWC